jgi:hypothetical protein
MGLNVSLDTPQQFMDRETTRWGRGRDGWSELPKHKSEELLCEGMGRGVDPWQFFLWPQYKHLHFSINIILK